MRYWDTSALVPLFVMEAASPAVRTLAIEDPVIATWWASSTECVSAIARQEREATLTPAQANTAMLRLVAAYRDWQIVEPVERVRRHAGRLLRTHDLRAADSLQLAAAITAAEEDPATLQFVTRDQRLALAASREGFIVVELGDG